MKVQIRGCSGGIGKDLRTTCLQIDEHVLIDCGTGVGDLTIHQLCSIRHVFLTHSHLDHIAGLPLLVDTVYEYLTTAPLTLHCLPQTYEALRAHIFNDVIWPDFFSLPNADHPVMRYEPLCAGQTVSLDDYAFTVVAAEHTVPAVSYYVSDGKAGFIFSGDTTTSKEFWQQVNGLDHLSALIVECAFSESNAHIATVAKHYHPSLLSSDLRSAKQQPKLYISHLQPGHESEIIQQLRTLLPEYAIVPIRSGDILSL